MRPTGRFRFYSGLFVLGIFLFLFLGKLYKLQIVQGADYLDKATRGETSQSVISAARGEIWDSEGTVWVTNTISWDGVLDAKSISIPPEKFELLYSFSNAEEVPLLDTLPLEKSYPYDFTGESELFSRYLSQLGIKTKPQGEDILASLSTLYEIPKTFSLDERRSLVGICYELDLRNKKLLFTDYCPFEGLSALNIATLEEYAVDFLTYKPQSERTYTSPAGAHVLGTIGAISQETWETYKSLGYAMDEIVGKSGVELAFEAYLHGSAGIALESDKETSFDPLPQGGRNVALTISLPLQERAEELLAQGIEGSDTAKGGAVVMMDVNSGDILSMASYPTYDLSRYYEDYESLLEEELNPLFPRAIQGRYAPGSTFKMVTAVAALEEGIIDPETEILDTGIYSYYSSPQPSCWLFREQGKTHGLETVTEAITDSCNVFFYDIGRRLGIDALEDYAKAFGLGAGTGSPLPGEVSGTVAGRAYTESLGQTWHAGSTLSAAIGQENHSYTPLELCNYIATLANGGTRYKAQLLKAVYPSEGGKSIFTTKPTVLGEVSISQETWDAVTGGMRDLCTKGSLSSIFQDTGFTVAAKTGSAQVAGKENAGAVFVAFAPYEQPEVALTIVVEEGGAGGNLAPMAAEMLKAYFEDKP